MDAPAEVLEDLKCDKCELYLSQSPVYLQPNGVSICGRCFAPERPATRNKTYETVARVLRFPCKYQEFGCPERVPFVKENEEVPHEQSCPYQQYVCPVMDSSQCGWLGNRNNILDHCCISHPKRVLTNPCTMTYDITKSIVTNFILTAFKALFLLHVKVCVSSGKIIHSVQFLDDSNSASNYEFTLDIKRNSSVISRSGSVTPQEYLLHEPSSVAVNINSLIDVFCGFDGTTFTVTLKRLINDVVPQLSKNLHQQFIKQNPEFRARNKELCANSSQGCIFQDHNLKRMKHQQYFCKFITNCPICRGVIPTQSLQEHYDSVHSNITIKMGSTCRVEQCSEKYFFVETNIGTVLCWYSRKTKLEFVLEVYSPLSSEYLSGVSCTMELTNTTTAYKRTFTSNVERAKSFDFRLDGISSTSLKKCNEFDFSLDITKKCSTIPVA